MSQMAAAQVPAPVSSLGEQNSRVLVTALLVLSPLSCTARGQAAEAAAWNWQWRGRRAKSVPWLRHSLMEFPPASPFLLLGKLVCVQLTFSDLVSARGPLCCEGWEEESEAGRWIEAGSLFHLLCPPRY